VFLRGLDTARYLADSLCDLGGQRNPAASLLNDWSQMQVESDTLGFRQNGMIEDDFNLPTPVPELSKKCLMVAKKGHDLSSGTSYSAAPEPLANWPNHRLELLVTLPKRAPCRQDQLGSNENSSEILSGSHEGWPNRFRC